MSGKSGVALLLSMALVFPTSAYSANPCKEALKQIQQTEKDLTLWILHDQKTNRPVIHLYSESEAKRRQGAGLAFACLLPSLAVTAAGLFGVLHAATNNSNDLLVMCIPITLLGGLASVFSSMVQSYEQGKHGLMDQQLAGFGFSGKDFYLGSAPWTEGEQEIEAIRKKLEKTDDGQSRPFFIISQEDPSALLQQLMNNGLRLAAEEPTGFEAKLLRALFGEHAFGGD